MTDKTMVQLPGDSPLMLAWNEYKRGPDYANTKNWATKPEHTDGSLWAAFSAGFNATQPESGGQGDLVEEGLRYFELSGDAGDKRYVAAIRAALTHPQPSAAVTEATIEAAWRAATPIEGETGGAAFRRGIEAAIRHHPRSPGGRE